MKLIAIVGMCGAGKTELSYLFENKGFLRIRFGDITDEILKRHGMDLSKDNEKRIVDSIKDKKGLLAYSKVNMPKVKDTILQTKEVVDEVLKEEGKAVNEKNEKLIRETLREHHGMDVYAKLNLPRIKEALRESNVVIDGLYSWEEYELLKKEIPRTIFLCVYSPPETRYERLSVRDERPLTREQAQSRDKKEIENLNKGGPIAMADYTLMNVGTLFDLENNMDKFLEWMHEQGEAEK